ncbi:YheC/YheD family endospore coat-associated protein [Paenibacillus xylaniclasticus]|uniref:YheC/YheD family endospore coat-associated protein n=1 Tax=Paenibacillus xylaniclasticus TaxID=588083 RepID=UPI000FDBA9B0|nr:MULTISPECIES: YheC/YheD family protein [Paenibacillus]GFN30476.1 endospore coat-associated protein YheC [Paenibacillus curdlanolyticus]
MHNYLGIMTHRVSRPSRFHRYVVSAKAENFDGVIMYTPSDVDMKRQRVNGYIYQGGSWVRKSVAFPRINIDIGFYNEADMWKASKVKQCPALQFTGYGLGNKCRIQKHLKASDYLKPYLLPTVQARSSSQFAAFLHKHGSVMLKPINGWGGRGIIRFTDNNNRTYKVQTNGKAALNLSYAGMITYVKGILQQGRYVMQKWIDIRSKEGQVFDIRALMQKNGEGKWQLSGMAIREGKNDSITSNIKSGGHAHEVQAYLEKQFGEDSSKALASSIVEVAEYIPPYIEKSYKSRLFELGIDLAVDRSGKLWLIEINIKPGKSIMRRVYGRKAWERCLQHPFEYARYLTCGK